jgi:hypothetical protein
VEEPLQQGRFANAARSGDESDGGVPRYVVQPSQGLARAIVQPEAVGGHALGERLGSEFEVRKKHSGSPFIMELL